MEEPVEPIVAQEVMENVFCIYFVGEVFIRLMAFEDKSACEVFVIFCQSIEVITGCVYR